MHKTILGPPQTKGRRLISRCPACGTWTVGLHQPCKNVFNEVAGQTTSLGSLGTYTVFGSSAAVENSVRLRCITDLYSAGISFGGKINASALIRGMVFKPDSISGDVRTLTIVITCQEQDVAACTLVYFRKKRIQPRFLVKLVGAKFPRMGYGFLCMAVLKRVARHLGADILVCSMPDAVCFYQHNLIGFVPCTAAQSAYAGLHCQEYGCSHILHSQPDEHDSVADACKYVQSKKPAL